MTPEEQEERKKRWSELNLNSLEDRKEARKLLNEMEREIDSDVTSLPGGGLDAYALELWTFLKEMKAALVAITDALPIIPTIVTREVEIPDLEELWLRQQLSEAFGRMLPYRDRRECPPEELYESYCDASNRYEDYMASPSHPFDVPDTVFITEPAEGQPRIDPEEARLEDEYLTELGRLAEYYERSTDVDDIREYLKNSAAESEELHQRVRDAADRFNEYKRKKRGF
jgi:hypothetical protein